MADLLTTPPTLEAMQAAAERHLAALPDELARRTDALVVRVADFPDDDIIAEMGLETPFDLLGLYMGTAHPDKSVTDAPQHVDMVFLYRRPILDYWCETGEGLDALIRHVLIHEVGHHFGLSDDDMDRIENALPD